MKLFRTGSKLPVTNYLFRGDYGLVQGIEDITVLWGVFGRECWRQGFSVALEPILELAFLDQAGLELTEITCLDISQCWD